MSDLKTLVAEAKAAKAAYQQMIDEQSSCVSMARYDEISSSAYRKPITNRVYRAVNALNDYLQAEIGMNMYQFQDLFQSYGYIGNPDE